MATLEELVVTLTAENKQLIASMNESLKVTSASSKAMEDAVTKFTEQGSKNTSKFGDVMTVFAGTTMANLAVKAFEMVGSAVGSFVGFMEEGIAASIAQEQAMTKLANSMAVSGQWTDKTAGEMSKFIDEMEASTGVADDVVASNLAMLSSMTQLSTEGLMGAQKAALNLSAALGIDLNTATKMVGKAAEGNTDAFKKYGITIDEGATKSETFSNVLNTLNSRFGGAATGAMATFGGAIKSLTNNFGNFFEAIADTITKNEVVIAIIKEVSKIIAEMTGVVQGSAGTFKKDLAEGITVAAEALTVFAQMVNIVLGPIINGLKAIGLYFQYVIDGFQAASTIISGGSFKEAGDQFAESGKKLDDFAAAINAGTGPLDGMVSGLARITAASQDAFATMDSSIKAVQPTIEVQKAQIKELTYLEQQRLDASKEFAISLANDSVNASVQYQMQQESLQTSLLNQSIDFETFKAQKLASQLDLFAQEQAMLDMALANKKISQEQYNAASAQLDQKQSLDRLKLMTDMQNLEKAQQQARLQQAGQFFGNLATLQQSGNRDLVAIGKAAAIAQATISGIQAVQNALAVPPYPVGLALAASAGIAAAANVAKIAGVGLKGGIDSVPGIGSSDNFPAVLAPGERVVPSQTNQDLTDFLAREKEGGGSRSMVINLNLMVAPGTGISKEQAATIMDGLRDYLSDGGLGIA